MILGEANHEIEPALADPHFGDDAPGESDLDGLDDVARREAHTGGRAAIDLDAQLREAGEALGAYVRDADSPTLDRLTGFLRELPEPEK